MQIPALWTDLTSDQRDEGRAYVGGVFFRATTFIPHGGCYRVTYARDASIRCGLCQCPIGHNHNYLKPDVESVETRAVCFECAEQEYHRGGGLAPFFDDEEWEELPPPPPFLDPYREVKFE